MFYLPAGDYRFRADRDGTQFWSSEENACTLPGCENVIISVTLSVTVNVVDTDGTPQEGLNVYAFDGETYSNYSEVTDENGQAVFSLPEGDYHFRADLNGTQFWSADENTCTLPGCISDSVTVTKPVTVTVAGEEGNPYADLNVYVFNGETYAGYSGKTDAGGHVTFTLPQGDYHFRANYDGVEFWSNNENSCTIPGCEEDAVTLPGGTGEQEVSIDYTYDALNRLISAEYSNGTAFGYTYDAAGNVLTYAETHYGKTTVTTYTYDAANQLLTAVEDDPSTSSGSTWQYSYDGNGSLIQTNPGTEVANGSTRYTYNTAGYLTKVEYFTTEWQIQSEMTYDGLGNRLEVTTYTDGEGNTTRYVLDGGAELTAIGSENTTYYLYGSGVIGTFGETWSYTFPDGVGSTRQLVDEEGDVNLSVSYTPWGDTMDIYGSGLFTRGYLGSVYDASTGLIYMGNGQYYDPNTGRILSINTNADQSNLHLPLNNDPAMMLISPLIILGLIFGRKKVRTKFDQFIILFVIVLSIGISVSAFTLYPTGYIKEPPQIPYITPEEKIGIIQIPSSANVQQPAEPSTSEPVIFGEPAEPSNSVHEFKYFCDTDTIPMRHDIKAIDFSDKRYKINGFWTSDRATFLYYKDLREGHIIKENRWWIEDFEDFSIFDFISVMTYCEADDRPDLYPVFIDIAVRRFNQNVYEGTYYSRNIWDLLRMWSKFSASTSGRAVNFIPPVKGDNYDKETLIEGSKKIEDGFYGRNLSRLDNKEPFDYANSSAINPKNPNAVGFLVSKSDTIIVPYFVRDADGEHAFVLSGCAWSSWLNEVNGPRWDNPKACDWMLPSGPTTTSIE